MGSGKSRIGQLLAETCGVSFVDTDDIVEEHAGIPISSIFAVEGEEAFRQRETDAIAEALDGPYGVIALGGGAATFERNWKLLRKAGAVTVYLRATPEVILERVQGHSHRPLLMGLTLQEMLDKITTMLSQREPWYSRADLIFDTDNTQDKYTRTKILKDVLTARAQENA